LTTPPEIAWIIPVIVPLIIGLLVGFIVKHTIKLMFAIVALVILLVFTGLVSITYQDIFDQAMKLLPRIIGTGSGLIDVLPYSTITFIIGLALGLWKG
jgi:uncharacterized membrane protein (Fun14 family)